MAVASSTTHPIAIIGAGLGGLMLASVLHQHEVPFVLFERDASPTSRGVAAYGGSLDMHAESGTKALKVCTLSSVCLWQNTLC